MKKMIMPVMILVLMSAGSAAVAQNKQNGKTVKAEKKEMVKKQAVTEKKGTGAAELKKKATATTGPVVKKAEDKVVKGTKGPEGQPVYEGAQGGKYYINKNGNKTYLKN